MFWIFFLDWVAFLFNKLCNPMLVRRRIRTCICLSWGSLHVACRFAKLIQIMKGGLPFCCKSFHSQGRSRKMFIKTVRMSSPLIVWNVTRAFIAPNAMCLNWNRPQSFMKVVSLCLLQPWPLGNTLRNNRWMNKSCVMRLCRLFPPCLVKDYDFFGWAF